MAQSGSRRSCRNSRRRCVPEPRVTFARKRFFTFEARGRLIALAACPHRPMVIPQTEVIISLHGIELARHTVRPGEYLFGRGDDVDFAMDTPLASRHHARL